jgi:hypothetical protein
MSNSNEFYAAIIQDSYHVEGDERSRTNPGHGYPAHSVSYTKIEKFDSEAELKRWVQQQAKSVYSPKYQIVRCTPVQVTTEVKINIV